MLLEFGSLGCWQCSWVVWTLKYNNAVWPLDWAVLGPLCRFALSLDRHCDSECCYGRNIGGGRSVWIRTHNCFVHWLHRSRFKRYKHVVNNAIVLLLCCYIVRRSCVNILTTSQLQSRFIEPTVIHRHTSYCSIKSLGLPIAIPYRPQPSSDPQMPEYLHRNPAALRAQPTTTPQLQARRRHLRHFAQRERLF